MKPSENAAQDNPKTDTPLGTERFAQKKDERLKSDEGYGAGVKDKTNPEPSTVPSSPQTDTAKPIETGNLRPEVND